MMSYHTIDLFLQKYVTSASSILLALCFFYTQGYANENIEKQQSEDYRKLFEKVFDKKQKIPPQLKANVVVNGKSIKTMIYSQDGVSITHLNAYPLVSRLESQLHESAFESLQRIIDKQKKIALVELKAMGVQAIFNHLSLNLTLSVAENLKALNGHRKVQRRISLDKLAKPADYSGYLNFYSSWNDQQRGRSTDYKLKGNINIKGVVFESKANTATNIKNNKQEWTRTETKLTYDNKETLIRYVLGDVSTYLSNPSVNLNLAGLSIAKEYGIDPYRTITPLSTQSVILENDAKIDLYLQGRWLKNKQLKAGEYQLIDLLDNEFINNQQLRLKITDKFGTVREEIFNLYSRSSLLKKGLSRYKFSVGIPSYYKNNQRHYNTDEYIVSGDYHYGLSSSLTMGLSFLSNGTVSGLGVNTSFVSDVGNTELELNTLVNARSSLSAYSVGMNHSMKIGRLFDIPLSLRGGLYLYGKNYPTLQYDTDQQSLTTKVSEISQATRLNVNLSQQLSRNLNLNINSNYVQYHQKKEANWSNVFNISRTFDKGYRVSLGLKHSQSHDKGNDVSLSLNVSIPLSSGGRLQTTYNNKNWGMNYNNRFGSKDNRLSSVTTIEYRDKKPRLNTNIRYQHPRFSTNLDYQIQSDNRQNTTLNVNTAVVFADGVFAVSAPINESFALLTGPNENKRAIAVRKGSGSFRHATGAEDKLPERYDAVIDGFAAVIPNLDDYSLEHIRIDNKALPLGADLTKTDFDLQPSYHRGYHLQAGGEVGVIVDGYLIDKKNKKLELEGGELHCEKNTIIPFFTNRAGRFRLMSVPTGKCQLLLFSFPKLTAVFFIIPNKKGKRYNLGEITIDN